jgi:hypothetical protein
MAGLRDPRRVVVKDDEAACVELQSTGDDLSGVDAGFREASTEKLFDANQTHTSVEKSGPENLMWTPR